MWKQVLYVRLRTISEEQRHSVWSSIALPWRVAGDCSKQQFLNTIFDGATFDHPLSWTCNACPEGSFCEGDIMYRDVVPMFGNWRVPGEKEGGAIAISLGGVQNFKVSDINVIDNYTPYSSVTVNLLQRSDGSYLFAKDGIVEHLKADKGHYGYGLLQCQAASNVLYRDLDGEGGAALRLETGAIGKANVKDKRIRICDVSYRTS